MDVHMSPIELEPTSNTTGLITLNPMFEAPNEMAQHTIAMNTPNEACFRNSVIRRFIT
jgi:hypothetical protein